ncbi:MAG: CBS domain-containing protein [archaeon]|nr:CBS domain-containing protein [archaeon]MCP8314821.1 CBS domain-containing protein [archaeon]
MVLEEIASGIVSGLIYGLISSVFILFLSMIFKYFTNEKFPWIISIIIGLGIVGISGGLIAILDEPTPLSVTRIIVASLILVWATNEGDKLAARLPRRKIPLISSLGRIGRQDYLTIKVPDERDINDIPGRPRVSVVVKKELAGKEFLFPADLPREELVNRVKRRLLTDWGLGDAELELDQQGRFTYFAISAREEGLSEELKEGFVALPIKYDVAPTGLTSGDIVKVYSGNSLLIDSVEVKGVNEVGKTITLILNAQDHQKCVGKEITQIVALPHIRKKLTVGEVMTRGVRTVGPDAPLVEAISLMNQHRIGSVIVVEGDKAIGILTDRDVLQRIEKGRVDIKSKKVRDFVSEPIIQISPNLSVDEALTIMKSRNVRKLPVSSEGRLVGIVTDNDIFRALRR